MIFRANDPLTPDLHVITSEKETSRTREIVRALLNPIVRSLSCIILTDAPVA